MRLIDADALMDEANSDGAYGYLDAKQISEAPTVDAVPVVRCRECKHYDTADFDGNILCGCTLHSAMLDITPDSFCSYGERKEGADNDT